VYTARVRCRTRLSDVVGNAGEEEKRMSENNASNGGGEVHAAGGGGYRQELNRALHFRHLLVYGMVFMVPIAPMGIYGFVVGPASGMVPLVYLIGVAAMFFTAFSYRWMSQEFPMAGSVYSYVQRGLNAHVGFLAGWMIMADYLLAPALLYGFTGTWLNALVPQVPIWVFIVIFVVINTFVTGRGITVTARTNFVLLGLELVALAIFLAIAIKYVFIDGGGTGGLSLDPLYQPGNVDLGFLGAATSIAVLSFLGFDGISTLAEETERPERTVGNATVAALLILGAIFVTETYLAALVQPDFKGLDPELAFFEIARTAGGPFLYDMLLIVNVIAVGIANALAAQLAISRILYSVSRDRMLPASEFLSRVHPRYRTPFNATVFVGVVTLAIALIFALDTITKFVNFGALTAFMALNISVIAYFFIRQGRRSGRDFIFYLLFPLLGFLIIFYVWFNFDVGTFIFGTLWLAAGIIIGAIKTKGYREKPAVLQEL
jgi:amino acid transporter